MQVLVVDDDAVQRRLLRRQLTLLGYTVREVANGALAWELLQHEAIPLVVTDWMMPELDGPSLIQRIRDAHFVHYTYLILLTAKDRQEDIVAGLDVGADDYLTKPCNSNELRARLAIGTRIISLEQQLRAARDTDMLTEVRNRRAITALSLSELSRADRMGQQVSLILLDIDYFKRVNDEHGHQAGDQALRLVAAILRDSTRVYDSVGRWGGEEFLLMLPDTSGTQAFEIAERLRLLVAETVLALESGRTLRLTVSQGLATSPSGGGVSFEELVRQADVALYEAKRLGRNCVCQWPPYQREHGYQPG